MKKNEIIEKTISGLIKQRETLVNELAEMDFGQNSQFDKKTSIECQISNIDIQTTNLIMNVEHLN